MRLTENFRRLIGLLLLLAGAVLPGPENAQAVLKEDQRLRLTGEGRLRLRQISSTGREPVGAYGEILAEGQTFRHRMVLDVALDAAPGLEIGVMVRQSDEGELAFAAGPDRLASERGSVALRYLGRRFNATMGYYSLHLTPLLLMRWDLEDNPEGGGQSACACPGAGGAITAESLEKVGPDLILEGVRFEADLGGGKEWSGFLARPRTAFEGERFRQLSYGTVFRALAYHRPSTSFRSVALAFLVHRDEEDSVERRLAVPYRPTRSGIVDVHIDLPVGQRVQFRAEGAVSRTDVDLLSERDAAEDGHGLLVAAQVRHPASLRLRIAYLRLSPDFRSQYRAISYESNRHGWRLGLDWERADEQRSLWVFYKRLRTLEDELGAARQIITTLSLGGRAALSSSLQMRGTWIGQRDFESERWSAIGELTQELSLGAEVTLQYQYVDYQNSFTAALDHHTHLLSLLSSFSF